MKLSILPLAGILLAVTACGHDRVVRESKETVIEKAPTTREVVIEKQAAPGRNCSYDSNSYSSNSLSCQNGYQYVCVDGTWNGRNQTC